MIVYRSRLIKYVALLIKEICIPISIHESEMCTNFFIHMTPLNSSVFHNNILIVYRSLLIEYGALLIQDVKTKDSVVSTVNSSLHIDPRHV